MSRGDEMDREESRKQRAKKRRRSRIIKTVFWVTILGLTAWFLFFGSKVSLFAEIKSFFSELFKPSTGVEATLNGTTVEDVRLLDSDVLVLSDTGAMVINRNGTEALSVQHGCTDPATVSCGGRFMVFDRNGTRWELYGNQGLIREGTAEYPIIDAAVSSNGSFVLVTSSKSYHNEVHYCDRDGEEKYVWYSADNYIYKAGIKENGKEFALLGMNSEGGTPSSVAFIFEPSSKKEPVKVPLGGNIFYYVSYKGSNITLIGQTQTLTLDDDGDTKNIFDYGGMALEGYANTSDRTYLVLNKYGVGREYKLAAVNASGKGVADAELEADVRCITAGRSGVTVLGSHEVYLYSSGLDLKHEAETISDASYACTSGDSIFVFGVGSIIRTEY